MEFTQYKEVAEECLRIYRSLEREVADFSVFKDVACNLANLLIVVAEEINNAESKERDESLKIFCEYELALKNYFSLLETFSDFRDKEMKFSKGYFPEFWVGFEERDCDIDSRAKEAGFSGYKTYYVDYCKKNLLGDIKET